MKKIFKKIVVWILTAEAHLVLKKYKPKIIAVTGSVGKTSTKDAIYTILASKAHVRKSQKSFNSEIGVPLTILGLENAWSSPLGWLHNFIEGLILIILPSIYPKIVILEIGADRPGDIEKIGRWIHPNIVVITRLSKVPVHVEFFSSPEDVKREKEFLAKALKKEGILILNADDEDVMSFAKNGNSNGKNARLVTYGFKNNAKVKASEYKIIYENRDSIKFPIGISYKVNFETTISEVTVGGTVGMQNAYTSLAAIAAGVSSGYDLPKLVGILSEHKTPPGRMKIIDGLNNSIIIDDSYNSSPVAQSEALEALRDLDAHGRKIVILGDMLELGPFSVGEHKLVGEKVAEVASNLITVGVRARAIRDAAINAGMSASSTISFEDSRQAGEYAKSLIGPGDVVLVKGSQGGIRMERAVEALMARPEEKEELLVRQEPEWQKR